MIFKQVHIASVKTMADGAIRVTIDFLDGKGEDIKEAFDLQSSETSIVLCKTTELPQVIQEVGNSLLDAHH